MTITIEEIKRLEAAYKKADYTKEYAALEVLQDAVLSFIPAAIPVMEQMAEALQGINDAEYERTHKGNDVEGYTMRLWGTDLDNVWKALAAFERLEKGELID